MTAEYPNDPDVDEEARTAFAKLAPKFGDQNPGEDPKPWERVLAAELMNPELYDSTKEEAEALRDFGNLAVKFGLGPDDGLLILQAAPVLLKRNVKLLLVQGIQDIEAKANRETERGRADPPSSPK